MTKILKSKFKASRRLNVSLWGSAKDSFNKKNYRPGQHGTSPQKFSDHGVHLKAKQTIRFHYGRINEKQFRNLFQKAAKLRGNTAEIFAGLLESRLDMLVYRMGLAPTIFSARQLVSHGHICVDGKRVNIPSARVKVGQVVEVAQKSKELEFIKASVSSGHKAPEYIEVDANKLAGSLKRLPSISDIPYPFEPHFNLIVEYYSH